MVIFESSIVEDIFNDDTIQMKDNLKCASFKCHMNVQ